MTGNVVLGGRLFEGVTAPTREDFEALAPAFVAMCGTASPTPARLTAAVASVPGARAVALHKLRQADPTTTAEWVAGQIRTDDDAAAVYDQLARCAGMTTRGA